MHGRLALLLVASLGFVPVPAVVVPGDALPEPLRTRLDTIVVQDVKAHETFLTSDDCAGRDTPQPGLTKARDYLVEQHKKFGMESGGPDGTYLYSFEVPAVTWSEDDYLGVGSGVVT